MSARIRVWWVICVLLLAGVSCETGEILTPAEATARARQAAEAVSTAEAVERAEFQVNDTVELVSSGFLIPLREEPGQGNPFSFEGRGTKATVLASREVDGEIWYLVDVPAGQGWTPAKFLKAVAGGTAGGPQVGDTVYLAGKGFLINLVDQPGGRIIAGQERGAAVTIKEIAQHEGETWYRVDAPTGVGWVKAENISTEPP